ncbi:hypothetical protein P9X10_00870 [Bacillus cereus]|nr:hypothetical protein [Bacillus cereus]
MSNTELDKENVGLRSNNTKNKTDWFKTMKGVADSIWSVSSEKKASNRITDIRDFSRYKTRNRKDGKHCTIVTRSKGDFVMVLFIDDQNEPNVTTYSWDEVKGMLLNGVWIIEQQLSYK